MTFVQGDKSVAQYYDQINALWQELEHYRVFGEDRVVNFLAGLSYEYDQARARLIGQIPFPSLQKAHA